MFKHLIQAYALWIKTILIAIAVDAWFILTMVLLKAIPITVFPFWMLATFGLIMWVMLK